jgi:hypothetical protein
MPNAALDHQANNDTITIEDVKQFIVDARKKREDFINIADRSWNEIEKRNKKGQLYGGSDLDRKRRWTKFPLWWSCWKIRQPLVFARLALPVLKDTQGDDPYGRTACVLGERFVRGILKTFDAFSEFASACDDFLVTNFAWGRTFYRRSECVEEEKVRLQVVEPPPAEPQMGPDGQPIPAPEMPPTFITPDGEPVSEPLFDDMGPYIKTGEMVTVDNEEVYFESGLYSNYYPDPDARKPNAITRLAYEYQFSYREFVVKFGKDALDKLSLGDVQEHKTGKPILVFEYHDKHLKEVRWFAENSNDFFQPADMPQVDPDALMEVAEGVDEGDEGERRSTYDNSDLYGLSGFFPSTEPLLMNASTREFWPTPEFFQVQDILDDIHQIVGRMFLLTKAIRVRFFYDSSIPQLAQLVGETGEGGGLGIPNLTDTLMGSKDGKSGIARLVAYFPVDEMIDGLKNMYEAFEQRLGMFYQVTGISDLIRGQTNPDSDKTFGERQMEGKFALNRIEPYQRKMQEWIKDNYQLLMEMGLKMFSDKSIDEYITPQTLDDEDKERYVPALELLKDNRRRRFRVDFETDSTIAINEQWRRQQAIETANTITKMQESVAKVASEMPELAESQLKIMQHVVGELTDGKLFLDEITDSIEQVIEKVNQPKEPEFDKDAAAHEIAKERLIFDQNRAVFQDKLLEQKQGADAQLEQLKISADQQIKVAELQQKERFESFANQLEQIRLANETGLKSQEINQKAMQLQADIALAQEELASKRNEFLLQAKEIASKTEVAQLELIMDARVSEQKKQLEELYFGLEKEKVILDEKEKYMTEQRLQAEHQLEVLMSVTEMHKSLKEIKEAPPAPITVHVALPEPSKKRKKAKIVRDASGNASELHFEEHEG